MREALAGVPQHRLPMPDGVVTARVAPIVSAFGDEAPRSSSISWPSTCRWALRRGSGAGEPAEQAYEEPIF